MRKKIAIMVVGLSVFAAGAAAGGNYDEWMKEQKTTIDMTFSQAESRAIASYTVEVEKYRESDKERIEKELESLTQEAAGKHADSLYQELMENEYPKAAEAIKKEHNKLLNELKAYINHKAKNQH